MTDRRWDRVGAQKYLFEKHGFIIARTTLNKMACTGGGPKFHYLGRKPYYWESDLDAWLASRTSPGGRTAREIDSICERTIR